MTAPSNPRQSETAIEVRPRQKAPLDALRYADDGMNVEAVCRFISKQGGEFGGFTAGNHLYVYRRRGHYGTAPFEVFPGDWVLGRADGGVQRRSHDRMRKDFEHADGAPIDG